MPTTKKVAALDGLRILAIVAVIVYHADASWLPGGYFGVTIFFVLTGYLATLSLERRIASKEGLGYPRYLLGRVRRLLPSMLVVVGVVAILCALAAPALLPKVKSDAIPALLFFENIYYIARNVSYFAAAGLPSPLTHLWFVAVTMQFYLVWPLLLLVLSKALRRRSSAVRVVALLAVASAVLMAVLYDPAGDTNRIYYGPDTRAAELLVGAALALGTRGRGLRLALPARHGEKRQELPGWAHDVAGVACLAAIAAMMVTLNGYSELVYRGGIFVCAVLSAVLIGVASRPGNVLGAVLGARPLAAAGARGFALYLWHYPLLLVMNPATRTTELPWWGWALEFAAIACIAELSYRLIERRLGRPVALGQGRFALAAEALALVAVAVVSLAPIQAEQTGVPLGEQGQGQVAQANPERDGYDLSGTYLAGTAFASAVDTINALNYDVDAETGATDANVLLVGDSVALGAQEQFQRVFPNGWIDAAVGRQLGAGLDVYNGCVAAGHGGDVVVFALGNNGVAREDQVRALIDACGPDARVFLVTTRVPLPLQDVNNQLFWDVAATYDNVEVIDWFSESAGHDEYFWNDGTHLRPEGAEAYVMMLRRAITGR